MDDVRLIDANALIEKRCSTCCLRKACANRYEKDGKKYVCGDIKNIVNAPTIEAEPVKHGYWIECDYKELRHGEIWTEHRAGLCCSVCRTGFKKSKMTFKQYCAACGAKMDGGEK